jgi:hypothetical protein
MIKVSSRYYEFYSMNFTLSYYGTCAMGNLLQASWVQYKKASSLNRTREVRVQEVCAPCPLLASVHF